jgi:heme exporter protein A
MIAARDLSKRFGYRWALKDVSLEVKQGEIAALLGPNGAGKTTLLRILATLSKPTFGSCQVGSFRLPEQAAAARAHIGFLGHQPLLYEDLSVEQNLDFYARLYRIRRAVPRINDLLKTFDLQQRRHEPARVLSRGLQQRLAIARILLHKPIVLLLDEPYSGLDQAGIKILDKTLRDLAKRGATVLFATHDLERAEKLARRVYVLADGQILSKSGKKSGTSANLYAKALRSPQKGGHD